MRELNMALQHLRRPVMRRVQWVARSAPEDLWFACQVAFAVILLVACAPGIEIDVCERKIADEIVVNQLTDGAQSVNHPRAIIALPTGGTMTYFSSEVGASPQRREVRGSLLDSRGRPVPRPCDGRRNDATLLSPDSSEPFDLYVAPAAVAPLLHDASGFLHTIRWKGTGDIATEGGTSWLEWRSMRAAAPRPTFLPR